MEFHEAANIFPLDEEHLDELAGDIRKNGLQVRIETSGGKIIDGRRRYLACQKVGVQPRFNEVNLADPVAYVVSLNLHRRHLTPAQRSMCAARATELRAKYADSAKERQREGQERGRQKQKGIPENLPPTDPGDTRDQLGEMFGVSGKSVDHAARVLKNAVPEVVKAVDEGRMAVSTAALLAA